jgi:hypothetical protein
LAKNTGITYRGNPPRVCVGEQEGPEVVCLAPGERPTHIRWSSTPGKPTEEEIQAWRAGNLEAFSLKLSADLIHGFLDRVPIPAARPHYSSIILDDLGNLWVEEGPSAGGSTPSIDFLVFDSEGALLGSVNVPAIRVLTIGEDHLLGLFRDELEIEYLQLFRILKP